MTLPPFEPTLHLRFIDKPKPLDGGGVSRKYNIRVLQQFWTRKIGDKVDTEWRDVPFVPEANRQTETSSVETKGE
jgi:hypothetical protein